MSSFHEEYQKNWRLITGVEDRPGARVAPPREWSGSEGDRNRFCFRPSAYPRLWQKPVCNDDGSPVNGEVVALLKDVLAELKRLNEKLDAGQ